MLIQDDYTKTGGIVVSMNPTESILTSAEQVWGDLDEALVVFIIERAVSSYKGAVSKTENHWPSCSCPECEWLEPSRSDVSWHGTVNGYGYHKCRCMRCRKAVRKYNQNKRGQ